MRTDLFVGDDERIGPLSVEDHGGEDEHSNEEEDSEHQQLLDTGLDGMQQDLQRFIVLQNVEDTKYSYDTQYEDRLDEDAIGAEARIAVGEFEKVLHVQRQQGEDVDDVHDGGEELAFAGREGNASD